MRHVLLSFLLLLLLTTSCKKTEPSVIPEGTYIGTFQRLTSAGGAISNVTITFSDGNWSGESQVQKYPALCSGTYTIKGNTINFENACPWTAEFDWTLILSGEYKLVSNGSKLEFTRDLGADSEDVYKLLKK
ncbi:hypothetical protein [Hymenobacter terrestris]|uniref:Lipocalin-like domain-containing protein n=1 Tax=Hymenobacter terrestris TaxID=2748310 RepID=A0ABX2Q0D0_9BACT|nr:hypothetical protein [Hymenobacter terrestris]NVO84379.1 hypothetical protein [Hymenobacter terrestris]